MLEQRPPLIAAGQLYLNSDLNEYLIVVKNERRQVTYAGKGFVGHSDDCTFLERFDPVDVADVHEDEVRMLLKFCPSVRMASTGFINEP